MIKIKKKIIKRIRLLITNSIQVKIGEMKMIIRMKTIYTGNQKTIMLNKNNLSEHLKIKIKNKIHQVLKAQIRKQNKKKEKVKRKVKISSMLKIEDLKKIGNQLKNLD